jgi:signal transduction histidine kinase
MSVQNLEFRPRRAPFGAHTQRDAVQHMPPPCTGDPALRALCHDLLQPLVAIRMLADPRIGDDDARLAAIRHEVTWLTDLVESVLDGPAEDRHEPLDLMDVAAYALSCCAPSAAVTLEGSSDVRVVAPRVALVRALICLLDNAARAAGKDGRVTVRVSASGSRAVVKVADDGPGLGNLVPQHSIGLVTVARVLRECGGRLELADGAGGGAVATVELPLLAQVRAR